MGVAQVTDSSFDMDVIKSATPVVIDFWAEWCGPCKMISPMLDDLSGKLGDKVKIVKMNIDENPQVAARLGVMSIPTLMIFKAGEMVARQVGAVPRQKLESWINSGI